ncbi:hypothetical protein GCM10028827_04850 [Mucilaginibacter myungsuensis]
MVYYPTENSRRIFYQLINEFKLGTHVFNIIGSYGTGKSSFLWALEQNLCKGKPYFSAGSVTTGPVEVLRLIGQYNSLMQTFADFFQVEVSASANELFARLFYQYQKPIKEGLLILVIDEFGKFLEYASAHSPEKELYFLQQLAEFANDPKHNIMFISTVHQNFDAYAFELKTSQRQEWAKVKGRFKEITFNEPVWQLLRLAADHLQVITGPKNADEEMLALQVADLFRKSKAFELSDDLLSELTLDLLPLDLFAANVLTMTLQRYGQNERSLFSFLRSSDHTSVQKVARGNRLFQLANVYDYLLFNFYSFIQSKYNPDFAAWKAIRNGLDEVERTFLADLEDLSKLVKTIGLLDLTAPQGSKLDKAFLLQYACICLGISQAEVLIDKLKARNIIIFRDHLQRYTLNEGTLLDVQAALIEAAAKVDQVNDVATLLKRYYSLPPVLAKSYSYESGTPRIFEFVITDKLRNDQASGELDGYIYLLFNENIQAEEVRAFSQQLNNEPAIYVFYENSRSIKDLLFELEKLRKVMEDNSEDKVAVRLLKENFEAARRALNYFILGMLNTNTPDLRWIWNGRILPIINKRSFNQLLSAACKVAYPATPVFNNELVNKHKISPSINTARKSYFKMLVQNWNKADLGFPKEKFPPEKTIYLSLLKENRISVETGTINLDKERNNIAPLWEASCQFLEGSKERRRYISEFVELLATKPFKLKQGLISFWVPSFLFIKRDEFALFGENGYVPFISEEILDLIIRYPEKYEVKTFDVEGPKLGLFNQYRSFLQQSETASFDNQAFIETIRPFLSFYRQLPDFTKFTKNNLSPTAQNLRAVIANTEDLEKTFFEDFPAALGYSTKQLTEDPAKIEFYVSALERAVDEIRDCFPALINRFEGTIYDRIIGQKAEFKEYKERLVSRYAELQLHVAGAEQKAFVQRVLSKIDDRKAWLNSLAQTLVGKPLETFRDQDEQVLREKFITMVAGLDKLTDLAKSNFDLNVEDVLGFEINTFLDGVNKTVIRMPKSKRDEIAKIEDDLRHTIMAAGMNQQLSIVALANLLKEMIKL